MFSKYLEYGYGIIPLIEKRPFFKDWAQWCERLPTEGEARLWDELYAQGNRGLTCGPANHIIAIDVDDEDPRLLALIPASPVRKRGKKGETRFFQYNDLLKEPQKLFRWTLGVRARVPSVEILSCGSQTVLPPSIHPETKEAYFWLTPERLPEFPARDLPSLSEEQVDLIRDYLEREIGSSEHRLKRLDPNTDPSRKFPHGSQDQAKTICAAIIAERLPLNVAVDRLMESVNKYNPDGYFEHLPGPDARTNAITFYSSMLRFVNRKRAREGLSPELPSIDKPLQINFKKTKTIDYPRARGLMGEIQLVCESYSDLETSTLALGAAISACGILFSNRFECFIEPHQVAPNVFCLNIARSGGGKEAAQVALKYLLSGHKDENLLGRGGYGSAQGILVDLPQQQQRLDIVDEVSKLFRTVKGGRVSHETNIAEVLCQIWSSGPSIYFGSGSLAQGKAAFSVIRPHVNILASTTPIGFEKSVSSQMAEGGLMPRFLFFLQKELKLKEGASSAISREAVKQKISEFLKLTPLWIEENRNLASELGLPYLPRQLKCSEEVLIYFKKMRMEEIELRNKNPEGFEDSFLARRLEYIKRLSLLDTVSLGRQEILMDSVGWAEQVVSAQWQRAQGFYEVVDAGDENVTHQLAMKMFRIVRDYQKENDGNPMSRSDLTRKVQAHPKYIRDSAFEYLIESERLFAIPMLKVTRGGTLYSTIKPES